jgi:Cof subfamily protein (haloacid dehalogenase superfamily)
VNLPVFDPAPDIRLIAADMDGTLLDDDKELHAHFWPMVDALLDRGILFCPASGRQYQTLYSHFGRLAEQLVYIAENGAYVVRGRQEISSDTLADDLVTRIVLAVRALADAGADVGFVVCGKRSAYIERTDARFRAHTDQYYVSLAALDDVLNRPEDGILKVAVYDFASAEERTVPALPTFGDEVQIALSGKHWVDVQNRGTNKGSAIRRVQATLGITSAQTMVFGDFLNDLEMMDAADYSFAMENAHPLLAERARYSAPANTDNGVVRTISSILGLPWTD